MEIPTPQAGLVFHYSYLWHNQQKQGLEEGTKERPCAVVLAIETAEGKMRVLAAPITHSEPDKNRQAIALPPAIAKRLGLDERPQWIITDDVNLFTWPGPDIRPAPRSDPASIAYGFLPHNLTFDLLKTVRQHVQARSAAQVERDE